MVPAPPALAGSKVIPEVPGPENAPPEVEGVIVLAGSFRQYIEFKPVKVAFGNAFTVVVCELIAVQPLVVTEYPMVCVPMPAVAGLKVAPVIPVPENEPPPVAGVSVTEDPFRQ